MQVLKPESEFLAMRQQHSMNPTLSANEEFPHCKKIQIQCIKVKHLQEKNSASILHYICL
jgi:hypothetical protein